MRASVIRPRSSPGTCAAWRATRNAPRARRRSSRHAQSGSMRAHGATESRGSTCGAPPACRHDRDRPLIYLGHTLGREHVGRRAARHEPPAIQQQQLVGVARGEVEIVRRQNDRRTLRRAGGAAARTSSSRGGCRETSSARRARARPAPARARAPGERAAVRRPRASTASDQQTRDTSQRSIARAIAAASSARSRCQGPRCG